MRRNRAFIDRKAAKTRSLCNCILRQPPNAGSVFARNWGCVIAGKSQRMHESLPQSVHGSVPRTPVYLYRVGRDHALTLPIRFTRGLQTYRVERPEAVVVLLIVERYQWSLLPVQSQWAPHQLGGRSRRGRMRPLNRSMRTVLFLVVESGTHWRQKRSSWDELRYRKACHIPLRRRSCAEAQKTVRAICMIVRSPRMKVSTPWELRKHAAVSRRCALR